MIFCILGKMSSGKDTMLKRLSHHPLLEPVVTMTTRSMRSNEKNGVDYHFVSEEEFFKHEFVEYTQFNGWYYGTPKNAIDLSKHQVIVVDVKGLRSLIKAFGLNNVIAFIIHRNDRDRAIDYLKRDENASIDEMVKRFEVDKESFVKLSEFDGVNIHHINNETGKFGECATKIENIIGRYLNGNNIYH